MDKYRNYKNKADYMRHYMKTYYQHHSKDVKANIKKSTACSYIYSLNNVHTLNKLEKVIKTRKSKLLTKAE